MTPVERATTPLPAPRPTSGVDWSARLCRWDAQQTGYLTDHEERRQQALKINLRHAEVMPFIPPALSNPAHAISRKVRNYTPHFLWVVYEMHPDLWAAA
jgi:hypothetical protein